MKNSQTTTVILFSDFLMFYQIFLAPHVEPNTMRIVSRVAERLNPNHTGGEA